MKRIICFQIVIACMGMIILSSCKKENVGQTPGMTDPPANNKAPVAIAGDDMTITLPDDFDIYLSGSASYDPEKYDLRYQWKQLEGPTPLLVSTYNDNRVEIYREGKYSFELTVKDPFDASGKDTVVITAKWKDGVSVNRQPLSVALSSLSTSPETGSETPSITVSGSKIILAGGFVDELPTRATSLVQYYDLQGGTWGRFNLAAPRMSMTVAATSSQAIFAGGELEKGGYGDVEIYDFATGNLSNATLSEPRSGMISVVAGNKILFAGGRRTLQGADQYFDNVDIYDQDMKTWTVAHLGEPRTGMAAVTLGGKVYFAGGLGRNGVSDRIDMYDLASGQWSVSRMNEAQAFLSAGTLGDKIYIAGGMINTLVPEKYSSTVSIFDPASNAFRQDGIFPSARNIYPQVTPVINLNDQSIYLISGGIINAYDRSKNLWMVGSIFDAKEQLYYFTMNSQLYAVEVIQTDARNGYIGKYVINKVDIQP